MLNLEPSMISSTEIRTFSTQIEPDDFHEFAAAFDIGTTNLTGVLLNGRTGEVLSSCSVINPQKKYGTTLRGRLKAVLEHKEPVLQFCLMRTLRKLLWKMATEKNIRTEQIGVVAFSCNTAMHHLLLGIDPTSLLTLPYKPVVSEALEIDGNLLLPIHPNGKLRFLPNIGGYLGGDIICSIMAADFGNRKEPTLMIDIGSNIKMVLGNCDRRVACFVMATPDEGSSAVTAGMQTSNGLVDHVWLSGNKLLYHSIGNTKIRGFSGSGMLELISCLLDMGMIDASGHMNQPTYTLPRTKAVITQVNIQVVQQIKAQLCTAVELMCQHLNVGQDDIQSVLLAGTFGNSVDPRSVCRIGILPLFLQNRISIISNAAIEGAKRCAISKAAFEYAKSLAANTEYLDILS